MAHQCVVCAANFDPEAVDTCRVCVAALQDKLEQVGHKGAQMVALLQASTAECKVLTEQRVEWDQQRAKLEAEVASLRSLLSTSEEAARDMNGELNTLRKVSCRREQLYVLIVVLCRLWQTVVSKANQRRTVHCACPKNYTAARRKTRCLSVRARTRWCVRRACRLR
jgi:septal ring factor EnvC (AmiA/AmiB activator)